MLAIVRATVDGVNARHAVVRALAEPQVRPLLSHPLHVLAAGKAASAMATAITRSPDVVLRSVMAVGTHRVVDMPDSIEWHEAAHPIPDARSAMAGARASDVAARVQPDECLLLLLSGGASALMAAPMGGITLDDKRTSIRAMLLAGADIYALNTVRKHLSALKGGRLAALCSGATLTLAVSDVVGDDLSVIGSGPGVADSSTWRDAAAALARYGEHPQAVHDLVRRGIAGEVDETPKPGDPRLVRSHAHVIASRRHALAAAKVSAESLGYHAVIVDEAVTGEAREAARAWFARASHVTKQTSNRICVLSAGETTVHVRGEGRGGRNQEFVLALSDLIASANREMTVASIGTDGIDGPTDAAGALVDRTTSARAAALSLDPDAMLADNNSYDFFALLGDLIHLGRTDTNVGDVQVLLAAE